MLPWLHVRTSAWIHNAKREKTMHLVETAWGVLDFYGSQAASGRMTVEQAQTNARLALQSLRYGQNDYFWINDLQPRMIMHPTNPALNGKDLSGYQDPNGFHLFVEMVTVAQRDGQGTVEYMWAKPGATQPRPKISFVKLYRPWGWIVGSGIYVEDVAAESHAMLLILLMTGAVVSALSLGCSFLMARSIVIPIERAAADLIEGAEHISGTASQISSASQSLAQGASQQAASLHETSTESERITSITRKNAETSEAAAGDMTATAGLVDTTNHKLEEMVRCMRDIDSSSSKIGKIIRVIDEIAFQTNILALNAAVEAARAGESGAGFGVVADEVRNLAQRSAAAARETAELIEASVATTKLGGKKIEEVAGVVGGITTRTTRVKSLVDEVHHGNREQASGIENVSRTIAQMQQVTQQTAAVAEESASASQEMFARAESMRTLVRRLDQVLHG